MARIDALYLEDPGSDSRQMVDYLARDGIPICRDRARSLKRCIGLRAIYQKPRTTIPLRKGFQYLVAIVDLHSRHGLNWTLSNSLDTEFCLVALEMALGSGRKPDVFHSDQGCQFTSSVFVARLQTEEIKISWLGRKRC
jgi:putative transposase